MFVTKKYKIHFPYLYTRIMYKCKMQIISGGCYVHYKLLYYIYDVLWLVCILKTY